MKAHSILRCEFSAAGFISHARLRACMALTALLCLLCMVPGLSQGQGPVRGASQSERSANDQPEKTYAPIGDSGYKVRIPEFRLKRIIGDQPKKKPPEVPEVKEEEKQAPREVRPAETKPAAPQPSGPTYRLPFEPRPVAPSTTAPVRPATPVERPAPRSVPEEDSQPLRSTDAPSVEQSGPRGESLKEQSPTGGPRKETPSEEVRVKPEVAEKESSVKSAPPKEQTAPFPAPPRAPEDVVKPPPPPKKEILSPEKEKIPPLLGVQASKSQVSRDRVESVEVDDMADPRGWLPFSSRAEPQSVPSLESKPSREVTAETKPGSPAEQGLPRAALPEKQPESIAGPPSHQARLEPSPAPESVLPERKPEPTPQPTPSRIPEPSSPPPPETKPSPEPGLEPTVEPPPEKKVEPVPMPVPEPEKVPEETPTPKEQPAPTGTPEPGPEAVKPAEPAPEPAPAETKPAPEEEAPAVQKPTPPPRIVIASPLDDDATTSREVRDYLRAAAPILEELSLLMTRGPSLAVSDFDPSDPNAPVVPKQIRLQMDWLKRELQVLDSKTFAIIPPKKYQAFHDLIRQSIAQTYQACDAVIAYLAQSKPEDLKKMHEHLLKARDLIQRTTEKTGTS